MTYNDTARGLGLVWRLRYALTHEGLRGPARGADPRLYPHPTRAGRTGCRDLLDPVPGRCEPAARENVGHHAARSASSRLQRRGCPVVRDRCRDPGSAHPCSVAGGARLSIRFATPLGGSCYDFSGPRGGAVGWAGREDSGDNSAARPQAHSIRSRMGRSKPSVRRPPLFCLWRRASMEIAPRSISFEHPPRGTGRVHSRPGSSLCHSPDTRRR